MSKHVITLEVDSSTCFDMVRATGGEMQDLASCLAVPLLTGELPGLVDAIRLAVYGITVVSVQPAPPVRSQEDGE